MTKIKPKSVSHKVLAVVMAILMLLTTFAGTGLNVLAAEVRDSVSESDVGIVTLADSENGTISFNNSDKDSLKIDEDTTVTIKAQGDDGYQPDSVTATFEESGVQYILPVNDDGTAKFAMPDENVQVAATFAVAPRAAAPRASYSVSLSHPWSGLHEQPRIKINGNDAYCIDHASNCPTVESFTEVSMSSAGLSSTEANNLEKLFNLASSLGYVNGSGPEYAAAQYYAWGIACGYWADNYVFGGDYDSSQRSALSSWSSYSVSTDKPSLSDIELKYDSSKNAYTASVTNSKLDGWKVKSATGVTASISGTKLTLSATPAQAVSIYNSKGITITLEGDKEVYDKDNFVYGEVPSPTGVKKTQTVVLPVAAKLTTTVKITAEAAGNLHIKKVSSDTGVTNSSNYYDAVSTAKFRLYNSSGSFSKTISLNGNAEGSLTNIPVGTYTLEETVIPDGFEKMDPKTVKVVGSGNVSVSGDTITIPAGKTATATLYNSPKLGNFALKKAASNPAISTGNCNYSLADAEYTLTRTDGDHRVYVLKTDDEGHADKKNIPCGVYKLRETKNPKGFTIDETEYTVSVVPNKFTVQGSDYSLSKPFVCTDIALSDPVGLLLYKHDGETGSNPQGDAKLDNAIFHVDFYENNNLKDSDINAAGFNIEPIISFDIKTMDDGDGFSAWTDAAHIIESTFRAKNGYELADFIQLRGTFAFPSGTCHIYEKTTGAPLGYYSDIVEMSPNLDFSDYGTNYQDFVSFSNNSYTINFKSELFNNNDLHIVDTFHVPGEKLIAEEGHITHGGVAVKKMDNHFENSLGQGDANLEATFEIYNKSQNPVVIDGQTYAVDALITTIKATEATNGIAQTDNMYLPFGTYLIKEVSTSSDYILNPWSKTFSIDKHQQDGQMVYFTTTDNGALNPPKRGGVSVEKFTDDFLAKRPEGDATLSGAEFTVYNASKRPVSDPDGNKYDVGDAVVTITTNASGRTSAGANYLPIGTYIVKETKAPTGYLLNEVWEKQFSIREDGQVVEYNTIPTKNDRYDFTANDTADHMAVPESVIRGGITIYKSDKDRVETVPTGDENLPQGDSTLEEALFIVINKSTNPVMVNGQEFARDAICMTLATDDKGIARSDARALPYGTYEIREIPSIANIEDFGPDGYYVDSDFVATVYIREDGKMYDANTYENNPVKEQIFRGGFDFLKIDAERDEAIPQGDATLEGALFNVTNTSKNAVYVDGKWYNPGEVCFTFRTDAKGEYHSEKFLLPYGSYRITESAPSTGYLLNSDYFVDFQIREDGKIYDLTNEPCGELVIRGDVQIIKNDKELDKSEAIGGKDHGNNNYGADLNGIKLDIVNRSKELVIVDGVRYEPGEVVKTIVTHWNEALNAYTAETTGRTLPYGTYDIYEVKSELSTANDDKANEYYLRSDAVLTFQIREDGKTVTADKNGEDLIFRDQIIRGDIEFRKIADGTSARMNTAWVVKNNTTGERHVIIADKNGEFYSAASRVPHADSDYSKTNCNDIFLDRIDAGERINMSEFTERVHQGVWFGLAEDGSYAEPNDDLCALPYGQYTMTEIPTDTNEGYNLQEYIFYIYENNQVVDLGTVTDDPIEIYTTLVDDTTSKHIALASDSTVLTDTVEYRGLTKDRMYTVQGTLYDSETKEVVATASADFKGRTTGRVEVTYSFDARNVAGRNVVAFETIVDKTTGYKIGSHSDIEDKDQTVQFPKISTTALSDLTADHDVPALKNVVIRDTVKYENLIAGKNYTITGSLMNKTAGDEIYSADGGDIKATKTFKAEDTSGEVILEFKVDASLLAGQTFVAFESLSYANNEIAIHMDLEDEDQTVYIPDIKTSAVFEATGDNEGAPMANAVINDTVTYTNLLAGKPYKVEGTLVDKATGESIGVTASKEFVPSAANGTVVVPFNFDSTDLAGHDIVVYEKLYRNDIEMAQHADINDESQTIHFPWVDTQANNGDTDIQEALASKDAVITDHVSYKNVKVGETYTVSGVLMDKDAKAPLLDKDGNAVTASADFKAESTEGTVDVKFTFDAADLAGHSVTVFETLVRNDIAVAYHADIDDENQTVRFPKISTSMVEKESGYDEVEAGKEYTFVDTISYENLTVGHEYEVTSVLMNKTDDKVISETKTKFTAEAEAGSFDVELAVDTKDMAGKTIVAFETMSFKDVTVAEHKDIDDAAQTITIPKIGTTAVSTLTGDDEGMTAVDYVLTDTVAYENLVPGRSYIMTGMLIDKTTGEFLVDSEGNTITVRQGFTAVEANGTVDVTFMFDASGLAGHDIVVYEKLAGGHDINLATHEDINDESQTVHFAKISTAATYGDTTINEGVAGDKVQIKDTVTYENLRAGEEYTLVGTLHDASTGSVVTVDKVDGNVDVTTDENGNDNVSTEVTVESTPVTAEAKFTPSESNGTAEVVFEFDATGLAGKTVVVYESLVRGDVERTSHNDIADALQSVHFPIIATILVDSESGIHESLTREDMTLVDTIDYTNLTAGNTYTVTGILMDEVTGEAAKDSKGDEITATVEFTPETADGQVTLEFKFDASEMGGMTLVAFEEVTRDGFIVAEHKDINDESQTVSIPKIGTSAVDKATTTQMMSAEGNVTIVDTVSYENLQVGTEYTVTGVLMDMDSGEELLTADETAVSATVAFTPEEASGTVEVEFVLPETDIAGKTFVAFETLTVGETVVAEHKDINDEAQTVHGLALKTLATAADSRSKTVDIAKDAVIKDTIDYTNLIPEHEYTIVGSLVWTDDGKAVKNEKGEDVVVTTVFTPEKADGSAAVEFTADVSEAQGKSIVCVEKVYDNNVLIGAHDDLTDKDQTVTVQTTTKLKTGIENFATVLAVMAILILLAVCVTVVCIKKRRDAKA